jgi:hypothetical protein
MPVQDQTVAQATGGSVPAELLDSLRGYSRDEAPQPRFEGEGRAKGLCDESVPGVRFEEPEQLTMYSGEYESTVTSTAKDKGLMAALDDDGVDRVYRPGREMMQDDQFSSAKVQRRPPKPAKRLKEVPSANEGEAEEQVKVPYEEVDPPPPSY